MITNNRTARLRAMARSYLNSIKLVVASRGFSWYDDYKKYEWTHDFLQEFLEKLSDDESEIFMDEIESLNKEEFAV